MRGLFVLFAALIVGLSPAAVFAHDGDPHSQAQTKAKSAALDRSLSPVCPPGSGHVCGCGNLSLCEGSVKPAVQPRRIASAHLTRVAPPTPLFTIPAKPSPRFTPALPRAPPASS